MRLYRPELHRDRNKIPEWEGPRQIFIGIIVGTVLSLALLAALPRTYAPSVNTAQNQQQSMRGAPPLVRNE